MVKIELSILLQDNNQIGSVEHAKDETYSKWKQKWTGTIALLDTTYGSSNNKTLNARLLARVITGCHYT